MTGPDRAAVIFASVIAADAGIAIAFRCPLAAIILAGLAVVALALFWHAPLCDEDGSGIEDLMKATREQVPDYVPAEWVSKP